MSSSLTVGSQTLAALDEEIVILESHLLGLKSGRNSLVPILRLPVEVVVKIIRQTQLLELDDPDLDTDAGFLEFRLSHYWRNLMVVCRTLRAIALAVPKLWQFIDASCLNVDYLAMATARAKSTPLVLGYTEHSRRDGSTQAHTEYIVKNFPRAYAACLHLEETSPVRTLLQIPAPQLNALQITSMPYMGSILPPEISGISIQLIELTLSHLDLREYPPHAWPVMKRLRLLDVTVTLDSIYCMILGMPLLEHLVLRYIGGLNCEQISNVLDPSPWNQRKRHNLQTIFLKMRPASCVSILKLLYSPLNSCQKLDVGFICEYLSNDTFVGKTIVEALEYIMTAWGHLFLGLLKPTTLVVEREAGGGHRCFFKLISNPTNTANTQHSSITMEYILDFRDRYKALGISFGAIDMPKVVGLDYAELTELCDLRAPNAVKLSFSEFWELNGLFDWLVESKRRTVSCTIATIEIDPVPDRMFYEHVPEQIERFRSMVDVIISVRSLEVM
jgi:hypothetical protein